MAAPAKATKAKPGNAGTKTTTAGARGRRTRSGGATSAARTGSATTARSSPAAARRTSAASKASSTTTARAGRTRAAKARAHETVVPVPVVTPHVTTYKMHVPTPDMSKVGDAGRAIVRRLPPGDRLAFYGGLGVAAVFGIIEWPVAAAIGIGTAIARRARPGDRRQHTAARAAGHV